VGFGIDDPSWAEKAEKQRDSAGHPGAVIIGESEGPAYCDGSMARFTAAVADGWAGAVPAVATAQGATPTATILTRGFVVKVIARIPSLEPEATDQRVPCAPPSEPVLADAGSGADGRRRRGRPRFPAASVAVLTLLAAVVWSLASWNDGRRLERARQERIARMQAFQPGPGTVAR
jgi:hypothetical protein